MTNPQPSVGDHVILSGTVAKINYEGGLEITVDNGHEGGPFFVYRVDPRAVFVVRKRPADVEYKPPIDPLSATCAYPVK